MANLFIGDSPDALSRCPDGWMWIKPTANGVEIYELVEGSWALQATVSLSSHEHPTHGNINFTGTISVGGVGGVTGEYEGTFKKIKVENGIVTDFELDV